LALGIDIIIDLRIIINGENKTLEWNDNILPLEEITDTKYQCYYDDIVRSSLCFTENISNELNHKYEYECENINKMNKIDIGSLHKAKNYYFFPSKSSANDHNLKGNYLYDKINSSYSIDKINKYFINNKQTFTHKYIKIKNENEIYEDAKNNLRYKIE